MGTMKLRSVTDPIISLIVFLSFSLTVTCTSAWGGLLKINMNDGRSIDVPYYWEENGEVKFEFAGGIAGVPKNQVSSIQEVLAAKEFDPEVLLDLPKDAAEMDHNARLQDFIAKQLPAMPNYEKLNPEQSLQILQGESLAKRGAGTSHEVIYGPLFNLETGSAELVRIRGDGVLLVMQNILSSRADLKNQAFTLIVYDGEGNVLQKKPCEIHEIAIDRKEKKKLEIPGHIFAVMATVKPDPKIKRFEIVSTRR
jgi:hypothetical protein